MHVRSYFHVSCFHRRKAAEVFKFGPEEDEFT